MRGHIFDIKRYAIHDGPGIRTTVFLKGCYLRCRWCHNPESQSLNPCKMVQVHRLGEKEFREEKEVGYAIGPEELWREIEKDRVFFEESGGGVTFSGGEPLVQSQFLLEMLKLCRLHGVDTCVDTSGVGPHKWLDEICRHTGLFLYDVKTADARIFEEHIGHGYEVVWENLQRVVESGKRVIVRIPVIPGVNDSTGEADKIIEKLKAYPSLREVNLLPYHRTGSDKYMRLGMENRMGDMKSLADKDIAGVRERFARAGFVVK